MRQLRAMLYRLRGIFRRSALEAEMNAEMQTHLDGLTERNVAAGMSSDEARHAALREFGGVAQIAEKARDERRIMWLEHLRQDLRYAVRSLTKSPSFSITAVLTLALGIGVNAGLFSLFNKVALRPLAVKDPDGLVRIEGRTSRGSGVPDFNYAEYLSYREGNRTLDGLLAFTEPEKMALQRDPGAEHDPAFDVAGLGTVPVEFVSENYFSVLGGAMQLGRGFLPGEVSVPGAAPVIVLSHSFWESHFHGNPAVIGATLRLGRDVFTVIGVAAREFSGQIPVPPACWAPLTMGSSEPVDYGPSGQKVLRLVGRLKLGVSEAQANADLDAIAARWAKEFPGENAKLSVRLESGLRFVHFGRTRQGLVALGMLFLGFALVLVIACTNVANLLLARGISRQREIGVRLALGASRGRIVRQLVTENGLLCVLGAIVGLGLGIWTLQILETMILAPLLPTTWRAFLKPVPDLRVLSFTALLTAGTTLVAGLLPALHTAGASLISTVHNHGTAFGRRLTPSRLRQILVIVQVAVCVAMLPCAGVLARKAFSLRKVDTGFDPHAILLTAVTPRGAGGSEGASFRQALETVQTLPGVAASGVGAPAPLFGEGLITRVRAVETMAGEREEEVRSTFVTAGFFETFGVTLLRGRAFRDLEQQSTSRAVMVSESLARQLWPGHEAVGRTLAVSEAPWGTREHPAPEAAFRDCEVIGVTRDVVLMPLGDDNRLLLYLPFAFDNATRAPLFVRPRSDSAAELAGIVRAGEARGIGLRFVSRLSTRLTNLVMPYYSLALLSGALGTLALGMASFGLYGLMTFAVNQRVREIGIRVALGAPAQKVVALFVREGLRLVAIGLGLGIVGGGLLVLALRAIFLGFINVGDPLAFVAVTLLFVLIALVACWLPARRATKVDPMVALRVE